MVAQCFPAYGQVCLRRNKIKIHVSSDLQEPIGLYIKDSVSLKSNDTIEIVECTGRYSLAHDSN